MYFDPFFLVMSIKMCNFAPVIESRFLYNLRAFSSPAEGVRLPISFSGGVCALLEEGKKMQQKEKIWMVVRTFNRHEVIVSDFLKQEGLTCFIPMRYTEKLAGDDLKPRRVLVPVIHNYVFVELEMPVTQLSSLLAKCATPLYILKHRDTDLPVEISNREMMEFRMLCDPAFEQRVNIIQQEDEPEVGKEVEIIHGPFAGVHGRLYRKQKKYWFVKTIAGVSVELRITRWFCREVKSEE